MGYAFISYSTVNQSAADAVRDLFKRNGIDTWMAPYNIPAGSEYAEVLYDALVGCSCLVLMLTENSQSSMWVKKEVNIAITNGKTVVPLKLEDIELNSSMKLYLNDQQIVPVSMIDGDSEDMRKVINSVRAYTGTSFDAPESSTAQEAKEEAPSAQKDTAVSTSNAQASVQAEANAEEFLVDQWQCYNNGYRYEVGDGIPVDYEKAVYWYIMGAQQGNSWCQNRMGELTMNGRGTAQNYEKAAAWFTLSANNGDPTARYNLASCYENGRGVPRDLHMAFGLYLEAAEQGHTWSQYMVGTYFELGKGIAANYPKAAYWYEKGAQQGNSWCQNRIGECCMNGRGVPKDLEKAAYWFKLAAEQNDPSSCLRLAECYEHGYGVKKSARQARLWRKKGAGSRMI